MDFRTKKISKNKDRYYIVTNKKKGRKINSARRHNPRQERFKAHEAKMNKLKRQIDKATTLG